MSDYYHMNLFNSPRYVDFKDKESSVKFYIKTMLDRTQSMFKYNGLPDTIPQEMLELMLQTNGWVFITNKGLKDLYAFTGGLGGVPDPYYRPTQVIVANPALQYNKTLDIAEDGVLIRNDTMLMGLLPVARRYASLLTESDISMRLSDIMLRMSVLISAKDDVSKNSAEEVLKRIVEGNVGVALDDATMGTDAFKTLPFSGNSGAVLSQEIEYHQYLLAGFFNHIGINANYNMKREALNSSESSLNTDSLLPLVDDMLRCRKSAVDKINAMYGTSITVELDSSWGILQKETEMVLEPKEEKGGRR